MGLELVAVGKKNFFQIRYEYDQKKYYDEKGKHREDLLDNICFSCGRGYYSIDRDEVEFCPFCGYMDRLSFLTFREIKDWSKDQNWGFLKYTQNKPFAVTRGQGWTLKFSPSIDRLQANPNYVEVRTLEISL